MFRAFPLWIRGLAGSFLFIGGAQGGSITFGGFNMTTNGSSNLTAAGNLQLIPDDLGAGVPGMFQVGSAYITAPFAVSATTLFSATFSYLMTNSDLDHKGLGLADGFTFLLQGEGANALGAPGRQIGYAGDANNRAITPSVAVLLRSFAYEDIEIDQGGNQIGQAGAPPPTPSQSQGLNLHGGQYGVTDTGTLTVSYGGAGTLSVTGSDSSGDTINISTTVDLSALGGAAFIGFTGASGSGSADVEITSFTLTIAPESGTNLLLILGLLGFAGRFLGRVPSGMSAPITSLYFNRK